MNPTPGMKARTTWSRILIPVGGLAMLIGAIDPMEGSLVILPGSGLVALGTFLGHGQRRLLAYRVGVFILIALGVGALFGLSSLGGFGGNSGRSNWWALLLLPYLVGWLLGICGPGLPRWIQVLGIGVGLWYLSIGAKLANGIGTVLLTVGLLTIGSCIWRLSRQNPEPASLPSAKDPSTSST